MNIVSFSDLPPGAFFRRLDHHQVLWLKVATAPARAVAIEGLWTTALQVSAGELCELNDQEQVDALKAGKELVVRVLPTPARAPASATWDTSTRVLVERDGEVMQIGVFAGLYVPEGAGLGCYYSASRRRLQLNPFMAREQALKEAIPFVAFD